MKKLLSAVALVAVPLSLPSIAMAASVFTNEVEIVTASGPTISLSYSTLATESTLVTGLPSANAPDLKRAAKSGKVALDQFDPSLGVLNNVILTFSVSGSTTATRAALCETLVGGFVCGSTVKTSVKTSLGASAPGIVGGSFGPPTVGGVSTVPTGNVFTTFSGSDNQFFAVGGIELFDPFVTSKSLTELTLFIDDISDYIGTGTVDIFGELWGETTDDIDCFGILLTCQGGSDVSSTMSWSVSAEYKYTKETILPDPPSVSAVPLPASSLLLIAGLGAFGAIRRRKG